MRKITLVDDDPTILDLYEKVLEKEFKISRANNSKDGFEMIKNDKPDLAMVDIQMPGLSGLDLIEKLKDNNLLNFPVLILTNTVKDENVAKAIDMGAREYILKVQSTPAQILEKIKTYFDE